MAETKNISKLNINILGRTEYDNILSPDKSEIYVVKEGNADTDNAISSRTYADVGREAIYVGTDEPSSNYTKVWVDTDDPTLFVHPADVDLDNLSVTGKNTLVEMLTPKLTSGITISNTVGETYTTTNTGWIFANVYESSKLEIYNTNTSGSKIISLKSDNEKLSNNVLVKKGTVLYISERSGTVELFFYPCLGVSV